MPHAILNFLTYKKKYWDYTNISNKAKKTHEIRLLIQLYLTSLVEFWGCFFVFFEDE